MSDRLDLGVEFVARLAIGSTLLLLMGLMAIAIYRRQSAATQYWIGVWTCLALLLLPPASALLPSWQPDLLDSLDMRVQFASSNRETFPPAETEPSSVPPQNFPKSLIHAEAGAIPSKNARDATTLNSRLRQAKHREDIIVQQLPRRSTHYQQAFIQIAVAKPVAQFLMSVYMVGLVAGLVRLSLAHNTVRKWIRSSHRVSPKIARIAEDCRAVVGLSCHVEVRQSQQIAVPVVAGMLRPMILLPDSVGARSRIEWPLNS